MYYSYEEIFHQEDVLRTAFQRVQEEAEQIEAFFRREEYTEILFLACGSSYWASLSAAVTMEENLGVLCHAVKSGEVVLNPEYYRKHYSRPLLLVPSRSGNTSETSMAIDILREAYGCKVFALVEYDHSPIEQKADYVLRFPESNEKSVCQTRSFTTMYLAMVSIAAIVGGNRKLLGDLDGFLSEGDSYTELARKQMEEITSSFDFRSLVALGYGRQYGVVIEGAYINIEMAQFPSHYYQMMEWRHGPIVLADDTYLVCMTCNGGAGKEYEEAMAKETREKGAKVLIIGGTDDYDHADYRIAVGKEWEPEITALFSIMLMQGMAYYNALRTGRNPDVPKDLVPWIEIP